MSFCKEREKEKSGGFSLMEVIIAVGIVSFAFVGIMSVFAANVRIELLNRDRITTAYLAQEGVEIVRQLRDNNWFAAGAGDWQDGIGAGDHQAVSMIDPANPTLGWTLEQAGSLAEDKYKQQLFLLNGLYIQTTNNAYKDGSRPAACKDTKFRRLVGIEKNYGGDPNKMKVTVTVYYRPGDTAKVQVQTFLYNNWYTN
jgi:type II secretory pathway pseudopilin PulG